MSIDELKNESRDTWRDLAVIWVVIPETRLAEATTQEVEEPPGGHHGGAIAGYFSHDRRLLLLVKFMDDEAGTLRIADYGVVPEEKCPTGLAASDYFDQRERARATTRR